MESFENCPLFLLGLNSLASLAIYNHFYRKNNSIQNKLDNSKLLNEILYSKILDLEKRVDKVENFNLRLLEKKIIYGQNREWDDLSSEEELID